MMDYADAKRALEKLHHELMHLNPSAAKSLEECLEDTLAVHRLRVPHLLRRTLASTNVIESTEDVRNSVERGATRRLCGTGKRGSRKAT
jgi:putative transposase